MAIGEGGLGVNDFGEGEADFVDAFVGQGHSCFDRFQGPNVLEEGAGIEALPELFAQGFGGVWQSTGTGTAQAYVDTRNPLHPSFVR